MKKLLSYIRQCTNDYNMLEDGDKIAVGVSGGKDSLALLVSLASLQKFHPKKFEIIAITLDTGYEEMDFTEVINLCKKLSLHYIIEKTNIKEIIFDIRKEENPCSLCAKLRRGALHDVAKREGCNKVALGHHFDDVIETYMLSLFYEGRMSCFSPVTHLDKSGLTLIRPMLYVPELYIRSFAKRENLPVVHNPCPVDGHTKRQEMKDLLFSLEKDNKGLRKRIFGAIQRYPITGWEIDFS